MIILKRFKKIILLVHLISSVIRFDEIKKNFNEFRDDNRGALLIPVELKLNDEEFLKYCYLDVDWNIKSITKNDLPSDFSNEAIKVVNLFRRKTINLDFECLIYFDYITGELIYCFVNENDENKIEDIVDENQFIGKKVASIHNHPKNSLSAPSGENFQILDLDFEDYELISGYDEFWIIEAKGIIESSEDIKNEINSFYQEYLLDNISDSLYANFLINYLNNDKNNIKIIRKEFD